MRLLLWSCGGVGEPLDLCTIIAFNYLELLCNINITILLQGATARTLQENRGELVSETYY